MKIYRKWSSSELRRAPDSFRYSGFFGVRTTYLLAGLFGFMGCDKPEKMPAGQDSEPVALKRVAQFQSTDLAQKTPSTLSKWATSDSILQASSDLNSSSEVTRWAAVDVLVTSGSSHAVRILAAYIDSLPLDHTREEVIRRAAAISDKRTMRSVLELLYGTEDPTVFRVAQEIFIRVADAEEIQDVLDMYDSSTDVETREKLEKTIALTSCEDAVEPLRLVVLGEGQPASDGMVLAAASALARIGTQPAVDNLLERLNAEETEVGCSLIASKIKQIRSSSAETTLQGAALGGGKFSTQIHTRVAAIGALSNFPSLETQSLLHTLIADSDPQVAAAATDVFRELQNSFVNE